MLSSISSFLPSALQVGNDKSPPHQDSGRQLTQSPTSKEDDEMAIDEHGVKKKKERTNEVSVAKFSQGVVYALGTSTVSLNNRAAWRFRWRTVWQRERKLCHPRVVGITRQPWRIRCPPPRPLLLYGHISVITEDLRVVVLVHTLCVITDYEGMQDLHTCASLHASL